MSYHVIEISLFSGHQPGDALITNGKPPSALYFPSLALWSLYPKSRLFQQMKIARWCMKFYNNDIILMR
jgi:hypothetical protein